MSDNSFNSCDNCLDDSFNVTIVKQKDIFDKLFSSDFEDESILTELSTDESLPQIILNFENYCNRDNRSNDLFVDYISGLSNLMLKLSQIEDQIIDLWICSQKQTKNCIFETVFKLLSNCYIELCLPKAVDLSAFCHFENNLKMSFYESLTFSVCQLVITLSKIQFQSVEPLLFRQLLSEQSVCSLLASDILCFTARVSKHELCFQYCSVLMTISTHLDDSKLVNSCALTNRLIPFLKDSEIGFLVEDYDFIKYSRIWRIPNIFKVLSTQQIIKIFGQFIRLIESGKQLNKYNINVLRNLLTTDGIEANLRDYCFDLFVKNFLILRQPEFYTDFIDILTVLLPNHLNQPLLKKLIDKLNQIFSETDEKNRIALGLNFIEKILRFLVRLTVIEDSNLTEDVIQIISSYIIYIYKNSVDYFAKYLTLKSLKEISLKSKYISIINNCCKDKEIKEQFVGYLQTFGANRVMSENQRLDYLQTIESKLRNQIDFKANEIVVESSLSQREDVIDMIVDVMTELTQMDDQTNDDSIYGLIDSIHKQVLTLKQNQMSILTKHTTALKSIYDQLTDIINNV